MKKIECIIRPDRLKDVTDALRRVGVGGMTVSDIRGFGVQNERSDNLLFLHKTRLEIYALDSQVKEIISSILMYCSMGKSGDGKIAVLPLDDCIKVSSGERGDQAISGKDKR